MRESGDHAKPQRLRPRWKKAVTPHFHRGHKCRGMAAPRSPVLIAATLMKPSPPGAQLIVSAASRERLSAPQRYHSIALLFLTETLLNRVSSTEQIEPGRSEIVKAIEHPVNFLNKNTLPIEHGHTSLSFISELYLY